MKNITQKKVNAKNKCLPFEALTSGDFSYSHAGTAVTKVKSNKIIPNKVYQLSPHIDKLRMS